MIESVSLARDDLFAFAMRRGTALSATLSEPPRRDIIGDPADLDGEELLSRFAAHLDGRLPGGENCRATARELGRRREARAVPMLERLCRRLVGFDASHPIEDAVVAFEALAAIGDPGPGRAVTDMITLGAFGAAATAAALGYLAVIRERRAAPLARRLLDHDDPRLRAAACRLAGALSLGDALPLLEACLQESDSRVARAAALALGHMGREVAKSRLESLLLSSAPAEFAEVVQAVIGVADGDTAVLLGRIADRADEAGRRAIAVALAEVHGPATVGVLRRLAGDSRPGVRLAVVESLVVHLRDHVSTRALEGLASLSRDDDAEVRAAAEDALGAGWDML